MNAPLSWWRTCTYPLRPLVFPSATPSPPTPSPGSPKTRLKPHSDSRCQTNSLTFMRVLLWRGAEATENLTDAGPTLLSSERCTDERLLTRRVLPPPRALCRQHLTSPVRARVRADRAVPLGAVQGTERSDNSSHFKLVA